MAALRVLKRQKVSATNDLSTLAAAASEENDELKHTSNSTHCHVSGVPLWGHTSLLGHSLLEREIDREQKEANAPSVKIDDLAFPRYTDTTLIYLEETDSVMDALSKLQVNKVSSAPVLSFKQTHSQGAAGADGKRKEGEVGQTSSSTRPFFWGFVDQIDLCHAIIEVVASFKSQNEAEAGGPEGSAAAVATTAEAAAAASVEDAEEVEDLRDFEGSAQLRTLRQVSAGTVRNYSQIDDAMKLDTDSTILDAARVLSHHHRAAVVDKEGRFVGVLTQSQLVETLIEQYPNLSTECAHAPLVRHLGYVRAVARERAAATQQRVDESAAVAPKTTEFIASSAIVDPGLEATTTAGAVNATAAATMPVELRPVYTVQVSALARDAFRELTSKHVSGLAVVNEHGKLVDTFSARDLMVWSEFVVGSVALQFSNTTALEEPLGEYLQESRTQRRHVSGAIEPSAVVTAKPDERLADVASRMLVNHVHREFVVDASGAPIDVVTFGDVLSLWLCPPRVVQTEVSTAKATGDSKSA